MPTNTLTELPDVLLSAIFSSITDTRTRNSLALVSRKFLTLERSTRSSLTLRGNARHLLIMIPNSFRSVTHLDLSFLSPWGHCLFASSPNSDPLLLANRLRFAFPLVKSLTVYSRSPSTLQLLLSQWPGLSHVKLIRWHQRPSFPQLGYDFVPLFEQCPGITSLDLSNFYYWTEDLPPVLHAYPHVSKNLTCLNLLTVSLTDGFKSHEIREITSRCCNLSKLLVACVFDPVYIGFVGDECLLAVSGNCPKLSVLHLVDTGSLGDLRGDPEEGEYAGEDARVSVTGLMDFFADLPLLEELVLDFNKNVRESSLALEALARRCPQLKVLKLGGFQGICKAVESQLDGVALCSGLRSLCIKKCTDLTDMGLIEIGRGCCRLEKFEVESCKGITVKGMRTLACLLRRTLVEVSISCCKNLNAVASLQAVEPLCDRIERLHIDCVWDGLGASSATGRDNGSSYSLNFELNEDLFPSARHEFDYEYESSKKRCKYSAGGDASYSNHGKGNGCRGKSWDRLRYLSLWICVGELLTPLPNAGLENCPNLEEIHIRVEGDCRGQHKPSQPAFGLRCLERYPHLSKMQLDCSYTIGFALTAPSGQMDLSLWERFFLNGIGHLNLIELDYWPPQDRDVNQRSLSLPAAGLLAECVALRKLFIHGTAHEHFMSFLLKIPSLRDVQLREDYYPAPENDMSTEMRVDSCSRFENALNSRQIPD